MEITRTKISGLLIIQPDVHKDSRGYFYESYNRIKLEESGFRENFPQDNVSKSSKNTIRGLHYQIGKFAQGKLCQVLCGRVLDVAVDIRFGSPTFGRHLAVELSEENNRMLWIPPGFAHGFSVQSEFAVFHYKCTALYDKGSERGILYSDPVLDINWKVENPVVSDKDLSLKLFNSIEMDYIYQV